VTCKPRRPGVGSCEADARDGCAGRMIPQSILDLAGRLVSDGTGGESIAGNQSPGAHREMRRRGAALLGPGRCARRPKTLMEPAPGSRTHDSIT